MNIKEMDPDKEIPVIFNCHSNRLFGVVHQATSSFKLGVLIVVGGPQYRVGSHRQFVLLARMLAKHGVPVMRFDYQGMGDSEGEMRSFETVDDDIEASIDAFYKACPGLAGVILWGLCDAASAVLFYGYQDERVCGLVLLNPWVFTEEGSAKVYLRHYYVNRLLSFSLWKKIFTFRFNYINSFSSILDLLRKVRKGSKQNNQSQLTENTLGKDKTVVDRSLPLSKRMCECFKKFSHPALLILSGKDLTAQEFKETIKSNTEWQELLIEDRVTRFDLDEADHTFSSAKWRDRVADITLDWVLHL